MTSRTLRSRILVSLFVFLGAAVCPANEPPVSREIKIVARRYTFEPGTITVRKGEQIKLIVTVEDAAHGIAIRDLGVDHRIDAHQSKVVEFTADREGRFLISCSVDCVDDHPNLEGELVVTAAEPREASTMQVSFDQSDPNVVFVVSGGERIRIDTRSKTVARLDAPETVDRGKTLETVARLEAADSVEQANAPEPEPNPSGPPVNQEQKTYPLEPYDYRLINVPTPKRVRKHSVNLNFSHRFTEPINDEGAEDLFGLDGFSVSALGASFGITDRLYFNFHRSPICDRLAYCKTIEMGFGYHLLDEAGRSPIALSAYASAEGADNFTENFTFNIQAMVARSVTKYVNLFFSPAVHINSNGNGRFNARAPAAAREVELGEHTGSFGMGVNAQVRPSVSLLFEYTPRVGFKLGQIEPADPLGTTFRNHSEEEIGFGIEKRIGRHAFALTFSNTQTTTTSRYNSSNLALGQSQFIIGFNLYRRLF